MVESNQESQGPEVGSQPDAAPKEGDRQSMLLKLAERTVIQAEALAQEITDHARQESEVEGAKLLAQSADQAKAEAQQTIESAQRRSETLVNEAAAEALGQSEKTSRKAQSASEKTLSKAQSESETMLSKAQSESEMMLSKAQSENETMLSKARSESEAMLSKARSESEGGLLKAHTEGQEILDKARKEALAIVKTSQTSADSAEYDARQKAEFIVRQTTQNVAEGIRSAVLEICNNLLPTLDNLGNDAPEAPVTDQVSGAVVIETETRENHDANVATEAEENSSPRDPMPTDTDTQAADRQSNKKTKSSARKSLAA